MNWDLYPQIIETSIESFLVKLPCLLWKAWNRKHYPEIDHMITIGEKMAASIRASMDAEINLSVVPLCVDPEVLVSIEKERNDFLIRHHLKEKFIVLFSGKMGMGHNIELILEAANRLRTIEDMMFVFIGSGPKFSIVEEYIQTHTPLNIRLFPWQDQEMYPYSIACGDIAIVTEEKAAEGLMLPSRVFSMMSCGEAIIGICGRNDDLYGLVNHSRIGLCVVNDDVATLAKAIMDLYGNRRLLEEMQGRARKLVEEKYSIDTVAQKYRDVFEKVMGGL